MRRGTKIAIHLAPLCLSCPLAIIACSESEPRASYEPGPDSSASLPETAPMQEAGTFSDAGSRRPPWDPREEPVVCATTPCAVELAAGERHFCARMSDETVRCWGDDTRGALGSDPPDGGSDPDAGTWQARAVTELVGTKQISAGGTTTCAVLADGSVWCWGGNDKGQLGLQVTPPIADGDRHAIPAPVALTGAAARVDVGQHSACAIRTDGEVWCWGFDGHRQLARAPEGPIGGPAKADLGTLHVARTAAGTGSGFAVTDTGDIVSWGALAGVAGSVSARTASISPDPLPLSIELGPTTSFAVSSTTEYLPTSGGFPRIPQGIAHACAVVVGEVYCWGTSRMGALGTGLPDPAPKPLRANVESETAWPRSVAAAGEITCVVLTDGSVQCAGDNQLGALGRDPETTFSMFFRPAETFTDHAVQIAASATTVCALVKDGSVVCWGGNQHGELGQGTFDAEPHPTPVSVRF